MLETRRNWHGGELWDDHKCCGEGTCAGVGRLWFLIGSSLLDLPESTNSQPKLPLSVRWQATQDQRITSGRDGPESTCIIYNTDQNGLH
ncbi:hypothetical protein AVEN_143516-1 [Araneus ventricosus]|uniref:Uncharacterized protein n=1 Tax=Araneus ventricosus TaxID=182803 RepID=A0A4Y2V9J7_ARAVE|nr:hypothetical protein AVEN_143516-1 [Araneus ventricosus]